MWFSFYFFNILVGLLINNLETEFVGFRWMILLEQKKKPQSDDHRCNKSELHIFYCLNR